MKVTVFYNVTKSESGVPLGLEVGLGGGVDGHVFVEVDAFDVDDVVITADTVIDPAFLEVVWRAYNVVDGTEKPIVLGVRSMSVGDLIEVSHGDVTKRYLAESLGFNDVTLGLTFVETRMSAGTLLGKTPINVDTKKYDTRRVLVASVPKEGIW